MLARSSGRVYIGSGLLGWGLAILVGVAPHEDLLVGAGLFVFGVALLATAPRWPRVGRLPAAPVAATGLGLVLAIVAYDAHFAAPLNTTKVAIALYGLLLAAASPVLSRTVPLPSKAPNRVSVATLVALSFAAIGVPLSVWAFQALFKGLFGSTPVEAFIHFGLILPLAVFLGALGWKPIVEGQVLSYTTPAGPLRVEVGAACSGVQAMALFGAVLALYVFLERPRGGRLAAWAALGLVGVYAANVLRLAALMFVGYAWGSDALLRTHEQAGWIVFVAWSLVFAALARSHRADEAAPPRERVEASYTATEGVGQNVQIGRSKGFSP